MIYYIFTFIIVGVIIGLIFKKEKFYYALLLIIAISILWSFVYGPWAIATFIELFLGYGLATEFLLKLIN